MKNSNIVPTKVLQKAVVVDSVGNLLGLRRTDNYAGGVRQGKWDLPGGSLDTRDLGAEKPVESAVLRELKEETGIEEIQSIEVVFLDSISRTERGQTTMILAVGYKVVPSQKQLLVTLSPEHTEYKWFSKQDLLEQDFGDDGGFHRTIIQYI